LRGAYFLKFKVLDHYVTETTTTTNKRKEEIRPRGGGDPFNTTESDRDRASTNIK